MRASRRPADHRQMSAVILAPQGLYCPAGDFYIDPWRAVPTAVITHGHADHARAGSARYVALADGTGVLRHRLGQDIDLHSVAPGQSLTLGRARVSLHPAGHILGSAQVRIEVDGVVTVVTGDFKRAPDPSCAAFEPLRCDHLITEATFALPVYRWRDPRAVVEDVYRWWRKCRERGKTALLCCYSLGKAQRLLAELLRLSPAEPPTVFLHGAMVPLVQVYRDAGIALLPTAAVAEQGRKAALAGELVLAPPSAPGSPWIKRFSDYSLATASGWMQVRGQRRRGSFDRGFVLSDHADWPALVQTALESGAQRVYATHGSTDHFVRYLNERGVAAETLRTEFGGETD
jgi:putative mRNA 3-end processing factor